jgi:putative FmdB family regulatory protein
VPTYQYACTACDERLEAVQSFTDAALTECPACSGRLRKVFSAVGVVFKGSGFYKTDSRESVKSANGKGQDAGVDGSDKAGAGGGDKAGAGAKEGAVKADATSGGGSSGGTTGRVRRAATRRASASAPAAGPRARATSAPAGKPS